MVKLQSEKKSRIGRILVSLVALTILAIIAQTYWSIKQDRELTIAAEKNNGLAKVRLLEEHAAQTMQDALRKITVFADAFNDVKNPGLIDDAFVRGAVAKSPQDSRFLTGLQFVNLDGQGLVTSLEYAAFEADFADRDYLKYLLAHPEIKSIVVGRPFSRFYDSEYVIPLARNVYNKYGIHLGIASTDISIRYFKNVYDRVAREGNAVVTLIGNNDFVVVRSPFDVKYVGLNISTSPLTAQMRQGPEEGSFQSNYVFDGAISSQKLNTYRQISGFPVTTVYSSDIDVILKDWNDRTRDRLFFSGLTILFICLLTYFLLLHIRRLALSEASLLKSTASLQESTNLLQKSENKFVSLFQHSPMPLALAEIASGKFSEVNDSFLQQFGYEKLGNSADAIATISLWSVARQQEAFIGQLIKQQYVDQMEVHLLHKDGRELTCLISARIVESNGEKQALCAPIDITHQREIEREIREINAQLEQRVTLRTQNLADANAELQATLERLTTLRDELIRAEKMAALGALVAGVAHELNTPIGNCLLISSTLQENIQQINAELGNASPRRTVLRRLSEESIQGAEILSRNLVRSAHLVESFKQVAVDQSSDKRRVFDLQQCLNEVVSTVEPMIKHRNLQIKLDLLSDIKMDSYPGALGQIVTNLVTNSVAHAFDGLSIGTMLLSTRLELNDCVAISFSDDGVGVAPEHINRVFDPFFTTKLGQGGSGLGLHICQNLATGVLGGKLNIDSSAGNGTKLTLTIPRIAPVLAAKVGI